MGLYRQWLEITVSCKLHAVKVRTDAFSLSRRLLFLGYRSGLQVWDCTNLGSVCEIVNISGGDAWGQVTFAGVLPDPNPRVDKSLASKRPLIGVM